MKFCGKCGNLMTPQKKDGKSVWYCNTCELEEKTVQEGMKISQKIMSKDKGIVIVKENKEALPVTDKECPQCGNEKSYWWTMQTRSSDEPETRFYKCVKCSYTWREYS